MKRIAAFLMLFLIRQGFAVGADLQPHVQLILNSPDASITGTFDLPASAPLIDSLFSNPILVARLWEAYDFTPRYKARIQGKAIHLDDPTGIQGDIHLVEATPTRRVYYGTGALNHKLVPAFRGRMALVLTTSPRGSGVSACVDVYIRTESRVLGALARSMFPLIRTRAQHRMTANVHDICTILNDISTASQQAAARLKNKEDAAALIGLLHPAAEARDTTESQTQAKGRQRR